MNDETKETLKKIGCFFGLCAYAVGTIGGVLACGLGAGAWLISACVAVVAVFAFPKAKELFKTLTA